MDDDVESWKEPDWRNMECIFVKFVWTAFEFTDFRENFTYTRDCTIQKQCFMWLVVTFESCYLLYA